MRKTIKMLLILVLFIGIVTGSPKTINASSGIKVLLDGQELKFDVPPQIIEGRTLLPLRTIFEALGLEVDWDNTTKIITGKAKGKEIVLRLDSKEAKVNGVNKILDVPAKAINGRTLVPVRFIAESIDMNVNWHEGKGIVFISNKYENEVPLEKFNDDLMRLNYEVIIEDLYSGKATIKLKIKNINQDEIIIRNHGIHGFHADIGDDAFTIYSNNKVIEYKYNKLQEGKLKQGEKEWIIYPKGSKNLTIEYEIMKNEATYGTSGIYGIGHRGYIGDGFALFIGEQLFSIFPYEVDLWDENIKVNFRVPENVKVFTPWFSEANTYYPNKDVYDRNKNHLRKEESLMQNTIAIGDFVEKNQKIYGTNVSVIVPRVWDKDIQKNAADNVFNIFRYLTDLFGESIGKRYMVVYSDAPNDGIYIWAGEWSLSQGISVINNDFGLNAISHQIFHRWNGWIWAWNYKFDSIVPLLNEGNNRYYEAKSVITLFDKLNYLNTDEVNHLENIYKEYLKRYKEGKITPYSSEEIDEEQDSWVIYDQGSLIWFALDMKLNEDTGGKVSTDDIMKSIYERYGNGKSSVGYNELKSIFKDLTGKTYEEFFNKYVFGKEFLDLNKYFRDDDGDFIPNYYEIIRGTDINVKDKIPFNQILLFKGKRALVIGQQEPVELFQAKYGLGAYLTNDPLKEQVEECNTIILLNDGSFSPSGNLSIMKPVYSKEKGVINIKEDNGKLLIYIYESTEQELIKIINSLELTDLAI